MANMGHLTILGSILLTLLRQDMLQSNKALLWTTPGNLAQKPVALVV